MCATRRNRRGFAVSLPLRPSTLTWLACALAGVVVGLVAPPNGADPVGTTPCAEEQSEPDDPGLLWWLSRRPWWRAPPGRPGPPVILEATEDSLTATWATPSDDGPFPTTGYEVQYRVANGADYVAWPHDGDSPRAMINGLAEVTTYEIRVRGENEFGTGDWSLPGTGTTLLARPRFAEGENATREVPENALAGLPVGEPVKAMAGRRALTYALGGPDAGAFVVDASTGQISTRDGVSYDHEVRPRYELAVEASAGEDVASIALTVLVTDADEPPLAPSPPKVESVTPTSLTIAWEEPGNTGPRIDDYDVEYRVREDDFQDAGHDGRATTARLTGLESYTRYEFRVRATNAEGTGSWSESGVGTTTRTPRSNRAPEVLADRLPGTTTLTAGGGRGTLGLLRGVQRSGRRLFLARSEIAECIGSDGGSERARRCAPNRRWRGDHYGDGSRPGGTGGSGNVHGCRRGTRPLRSDGLLRRHGEHPDGWVHGHVRAR